MGEWLPWPEEKVEFLEATAQRFMRLAREYTNPSLVTDLGVSKALVLLALPASERDEFWEKKHTVNGEESNKRPMIRKPGITLRLLLCMQTYCNIDMAQKGQASVIK